MIASAVVVAVLAAASPATSPARRASKPLLRPAAPTLRTPIAVTWKAKAPRRGLRYAARLTIRNPENRDCVDFAGEVELRQTRSGFTGSLRPRAFNTTTPQWCPGSALVTIIRIGPRNLHSGALAGARVTIGLGPGEQQPGERPGVPTKLTLLPGSTITASAPGRPDRATPVTGTLRGAIPARFKPNTDVSPAITSGGLTPTAFAADPLCPGTTPPPEFGLGGDSVLTLFAAGNASMTLVLGGAPSQLFGCGPAGPLSGTTTFSLTGKAGPRGLQELPLNGAVTGIPLPGGSTGGLAANLVVNVDLSGSG